MGFSGLAVHLRSFPVLRQLFTNVIVAPEVGQCLTFHVVPVGLPFLMAGLVVSSRLVASQTCIAPCLETVHWPHLESPAPS